jgi:hypothetical protein
VHRQEAPSTNVQILTRLALLYSYKKKSTYTYTDVTRRGVTYAAEEEARLVASLLMYQDAYILVFEIFFFKYVLFNSSPPSGVWTHV